MCFQCCMGPPKRVKSSKTDSFLSGYHSYGKYFLIFSFHPISAWPDGHFGVLHDHISASINAWVPQNPQKGQNRQKCDVSVMVTMVTMVTIMITENIFHFFSFDPDSALLDGHCLTKRHTRNIFIDIKFVKPRVWKCITRGGCSARFSRHAPPQRSLFQRWVP